MLETIVVVRAQKRIFKWGQARVLHKCWKCLLLVDTKRVFDHVPVLIEEHMDLQLKTLIRKYGGWTDRRHHEVLDTPTRKREREREEIVREAEMQLKMKETAENSTNGCESAAWPIGRKGSHRKRQPTPFQETKSSDHKR